MVNGSSVVAPPSYVIGITEGSAATSKTLVLNSTLDISGINSLSATNLSGAPQTAAQPNITSVGTLSSISTSGSLTMSGISISSTEIGVLDGVVPETAVASKALVLNGSSNISGIASLSAASLTAISGATTIGASGIISLSNNISATASNSAALVITGGVASRDAYISEYLHLGGTSLSGAAWGVNGACLRVMGATYIDNTSSGTVSPSVMNSFARPTLTANAFATYTTGATVYIAGCPIAGANITITKPYSLWIASGAVLFADTTASSSTTTGALVVRGGLGVGGTVSATSLSGTIQTAAQPNITSVGTLTSLTVSGSLTGTLSTAAQPNITSVGTLTSLDVSGALRASTLTGTIQTAAQPNITSLGNLTGLNVRSAATTGAICNITMPAQAAGSCSWITIGKSSSGNEGGRIGYYHDSQTRMTGSLTFSGASRTISNVSAYSGSTITTSGDITCGGSLKGYLGYGNQSTISTVGVLTEVAIGSTGVFDSQEYLLITGNGSNYLDGSYTRCCSFYGSNITPAWFQIEVSNGSKTVSTSATWIGNNSDTDLRFGTNNSTYSICLGGTNRGRWGFGTTSPAYGHHNALTVSTTIDAAGSGVAYFLKLGRLVSNLGPLSAIPVGIGTPMLKVESLLFRYKSDDDTIPLQIGYKAQDLIRVGLPHCINFVPNEYMHVEDPKVDTEGIQYSVDYSIMVCLLHKLVLKQQR
ncbi:unnamed protein product [Phytophthora fragariaefolia]|uniref:Unnamed protein product n=1 Tax=Phytophthora fragariaefolia TaxID=1490495 RepID=A0A9W6XEE0_9STRA|nr:unnamed protein product [Phytophthora fragariaefolia]